MTAITIWLDKDPCALGDDATEADVDRYHARLEQLLLDEFDDVEQICMRRQIGGWRWRCQDHSGVDARIREIETGDEWIALAAAGAQSHPATLAQPVEDDDIRRPREVQILLEQLAAVGLTLAPLRGPTEQEQRGIDRALDAIDVDDPTVTAHYAESTIRDLRAARRWWDGRQDREPTNSQLRQATGIAGSYHVALAELRGQKQCPGGRWPTCEGRLDD